MSVQPEDDALDTRGLVEVDGSVIFSELALALADRGFTIKNNPFTRRLRIEPIPAFIREQKT